MIVIKILLLGFLFLFLFLLFIILILIISPIKGQVWCTEKSVKLRGKYLFGLLQVDFTPGNMKITLAGFNINKNSKLDEKDNDDETSDVKKTKKKKTKSKKAKKKKGRPSREVIFISLRLIKKLLKKIAPREIDLSVALGLDDPYDTGIVCLINQTLLYPLNKVNGYNLRFEPIYNDLDLRVEGYGKINFSIASLLLPIFLWAIKKPIRTYMGWTIGSKK